MIIDGVSFTFEFDRCWRGASMWMWEALECSLLLKWRQGFVTWASGPPSGLPQFRGLERMLFTVPDDPEGTFDTRQKGGGHSTWRRALFRLVLIWIQKAQKLEFNSRRMGRPVI